jgi:MarR family transcriptional regulator, 2-MHQ and catechol-resistance regulon repressor
VKKSDRMKAPRLWLVIAKSYRALSLLAEQSIANTGLCLTDFAALEALLHKGPLTISEIQVKVRLASGSMTAAVDRLEKLQLVVRKSSPSDRRARIVELTVQGKRLAASCFERHAKDLETLMSVLSAREMEQLYGSLKKLGLLAAEKLDQQEAKVKSSQGQARKLEGSQNHK